ncbi:hypothetical protein ABH15_02620 [Methanoculleus taiwanensis]|uniref:Uncharacterized protein n=1 Tax=Methanoculleus taiwanensis TaxID=1550565 RepID=A0A498H2M4_9EURY|nr:hypothetical protein [Methanoculleus taiwanensis]RXE57043.1 hypothetical protein ABH15_02620 [Methanoculleus taiwanensis]
MKPADTFRGGTDVVREDESAHCFTGHEKCEAERSGYRFPSGEGGFASSSFVGKGTVFFFVREMEGIGWMEDPFSHGRGEMSEPAYRRCRVV